MIICFVVACKCILKFHQNYTMDFLHYYNTMRFIDQYYCTKLTLNQSTRVSVRITNVRYHILRVHEITS